MTKHPDIQLAVSPAPVRAAPVGQTAYVSLMMAIIGRGLVSMSEVDPSVREEISAFPAGYTIQMMVMPQGPAFTVEVQENGTLALQKNFTGRANLAVMFKHISHAFLVFSFQEGTARAFANDRMFVDGNIAHAIRLVRCLNRMEAVILPKFIAVLALKRYPNMTIGDKFTAAFRTYSRLVVNLAKGN